MEDKPIVAVYGRPELYHSTNYYYYYRQVQEGASLEKNGTILLLGFCLVCFSSSQRDYPKSLSQCLQERGLSVEMLYLQAESGLTRALQDVRADGSPLCILVEQKNVALSSCTVIIFSESLKIHRNMPKDQALDFVQAEYSRGLLKETSPRDPADIAAQASQLLDDYLDREKIARHTVPSETRHLLSLLAEGVHLYIEELETISEYIASRQEHLQGETPVFNSASSTVSQTVVVYSLALLVLALALDGEDDKGNMIPPGLGKPPPLLPTPPGPAQGQVPLSPHDPYGPQGLSRGPLLHHAPPLYPGLRAPPRPRVAPPSLKGSRPPLLSTPGE
uniref:Nuclear receptor coactivator 5-like n=1 Tax=Fundulus heteroclitus TaxID=8078 RepID=A0A3Q2PZ77_FUNHE